MSKLISKIYNRLFTFRFVRRKLSMSNLIRLGKDNATDDKTLVVYVEFPHEKYFPNRVELEELKTGTDKYYNLLAGIPSDTYKCILCTGLLEHMKDPKKLILECYRILEPGGKLIMSASAVFPFHRGPDNYFHFTHIGIKLLLEGQGWSKFDIKGSSQPFETVGILLQRILLQCKIFPPIRPIIELMAWTIRIFDVFIFEQYDTRNFREDRVVDSMMPSNVQLVAIK